MLGNVNVLGGGYLDASTAYSRLTVGGNVTGSPGSFVALGCTPAHPCDGFSDNAEDSDVPYNTSTYDTINGNVALDRVSGAAINGVTIGSNLTENGGGAGLDQDFPPFSVKDDTVRGNILINGLRTGWFGLIRSTVGGNVSITNNMSANDPNDPFGMQTDSSEVVANTIRGNLLCLNNTPAAQFGDAANPVRPVDYGWNHVRGIAAGECASLVSR